MGLSCTFMRIAAALFAVIALLPFPALADPCAVLARQVDAAGQGAVFIASYLVATDKALKNVAFLYDNAAAALALTGCGDGAHAARIGDAILQALDHDCSWHDGRLRNAYLAGPATNPVKLGGWQENDHWAEDGYQAGSDTGNLAWAMLALLGLGNAGAGDRYLRGALHIAAYVEKSFDAPGFTGGTFGGEPSPQRNTWKSTEHNVDLAAAFARLADVTHDAHWTMRARQARALIAAMWNKKCGCLAAGTGLDGKTPNRFLALDAQLWPLLALPGGVARYGTALKTARAKMAVREGFAYGQAGGAVWTEGTAQAALLAALMNQPQQAARLLAAVERNRAPDGGYFAADRDADTGFQSDTDPSQARRYFHTPHLGALAWAAMAERRFNPFAFGATLPSD
jgi:hypothetical protein